jgi:spermidine/putrescine-binding protein
MFMFLAHFTKKTYFVCVLILVLSLLVASCAKQATPEATIEETTAPVVQPQESTCKELNVLSWEGYSDDQWVKPFEEQNNIKVNITYITSGDEEIAKLATGGAAIYDVVNVGTDNRLAIKSTGGIKPIDVTKLSNWNNLPTFLAEPYVIDGQQWAMPFTWDVNPMLYDSSYFATPPASWNVLWDPELKGKVAVWDEISSLYIGAAALGIGEDDPNEIFDMTDEQLAAIKAKMIELKPNIRKLWTSGGEAIDLFANKEVVIGLGWSYIYNQLKERGIDNIEAAVIEKQGAHGWIDGWGITGRPECLDMSYKYLDYLVSPEVMKQVIDVNGYAVSNFTVADSVDPETAQRLHMDDPELLDKILIVKVDPVRRERYVETWNEIKAALSGQ